VWGEDEFFWIAARWTSTSGGCARRWNENASNPVRILTVRGVGYRYSDEAE